jgi:hypothetical protein
MRENIEELIELLTKMRIESVFNGKNNVIKIKQSDLYLLCIKLLKLVENGE